LFLQAQYCEAGDLNLKKNRFSEHYDVYWGGLYVHSEYNYPSWSQMEAFVNMDRSQRESILDKLVNANGDEPTSVTMHLLCFPYWEHKKMREEMWWDRNISSRMAFLDL
jgi:hypothetical protein